MFPVYALKQHGQLSGCQVDFTVTGHWPDEAPTLKPFGDQAQAIGISLQHLEHITPTTAEDEDLRPENGLSFSAFCTFEARPLNPLRISVTPATIQMRVPAGNMLIVQPPSFRRLAYTEVRESTHPGCAVFRKEAPVHSRAPWLQVAA